MPLLNLRATGYLIYEPYCKDSLYQNAVTALVAFETHDATV